MNRIISFTSTASRVLNRNLARPQKRFNSNTSTSTVVNSKRDAMIGKLYASVWVISIVGGGVVGGVSYVNDAVDVISKQNGSYWSVSNNDTVNILANGFFGALAGAAIGTGVGLVSPIAIPLVPYVLYKSYTLEPQKDQMA